MSMTNSSYPPTVSYWEIKQYFNNIDLLIVGSGIVGLTSAIFYKQKHPNHRVIILEKGTLPAGASTKNAGFACFGSLSEVLSDLEHSTNDEVFKLVFQRISGLKQLRQLVGDDNLRFQECGGFELFGPKEDVLFEQCVGFMDEINERLESELKWKAVYRIASDKIAEFGFDGVRNLILNRCEGSIDTGKMMSTLTQLARSMGIIILNGMEVSNWSSSSNKASVVLKNGMELSARKLHFATNGFAKRLFPELDVKPARAQVLVTSEIPGLRVNGTFHMNEGFYYFRNVENRILLGGGRNLNLEGETTTELDITEQIQSKLDDLLATVILPKTEFKVEHRWAGVMGVGQKKKAIVKQISENVSCSVRLGGMGVAIGTSIGKQSAELLE